MVERLCSVCGQHYPATTQHFSPDKRNHTGLHRMCKTCRATQRREKLADNAQARAAAYYKDHPSELELAQHGHFFGQWAKKRWKDYTTPRTREIRDPRTYHLRNKQRLFVINYKSTHPCVDCGESNPVCLQFHHRDRSTKSFEISKGLNANYSIPELVQEIEKCDVVCANCHLKRHHPKGHKTI